MTKIVLITGCSSGIGKALAVAFADRGYRVWATARNLDSIKELAEKGIKTASLDVTQGDQAQSVVRQMLEDEGRIDILVNNAGYGAMGPMSETPRSELIRQFDTNVFAPMELSNAVIPFMQKQKEGGIINIGSISGLVTTPFSGSYCASKAAFNALSDAMRMELKPFGIDVWTVQPGAIQSSFAKNANKALDRVLKPDSAYMSIEDGLRARANASQDRPTPASKVADVIIRRLESGRKGGIIRVGNGCYALPGLKALLPVAWFEAILERRFKLHRLK